jgi:hypothetical protein
MKKLRVLLLAAVLAGCAGHGGGLRVGESTADDVFIAMGQPAMEWVESDGSRRLAFPRSPWGVHTYMVDILPNGVLDRVENVMTPAAFARVQAGMTTAQILHLLGPSISQWSSYYEARDELVWGWRYCDDWSQLARFFVLFDGTTETVRSTLTLKEDQVGHCVGGLMGCWCSR